MKKLLSLFLCLVLVARAQVANTGHAADAGSVAPDAGGDVVGPGSSTDKALVRWNGTTGKLLQDSSVSLTGTAFLGLTASDLTFTAGGTNQNVRVQPSGTGRITYSYGDQISIFLGKYLWTDATTTVDGVLEINNAGSSSTAENGFLRFRRARNTLSSPQAVTNSDYFASLSADGYDGTSYAAHSDTAIVLQAAGDFTSMSHPTRISILNTASGSTSKRETFAFEADGSFTFATTGSMSSTGNKLTFASGANIDGTGGTLGFNSFGTNKNIAFQPTSGGFTTFDASGLNTPIYHNAVSGGMPVGTTGLWGQVTGSWAMVADSYGTSVNSAILGRRARGTISSIAAITTDDILLALSGRGAFTNGGSVAFTSSANATINLVAAEAWSDSSHNGTYITLQTTPLASGTRAESMRISGGAASVWQGGVGNLTIRPGSGNSLTTTFQTTTSGGTATNALVLGADQSATFGAFTVMSTDTLSGAGAVSVTKDTTKLTSTGVAQAITLANGTDGQIKHIIHDVDGGSMVLTPTTKTGWSTATFTNAGDSLTLEYVTTRGWIVLGSYGTVVAP